MCLQNCVEMRTGDARRVMEVRMSARARAPQANDRQCYGQRGERRRCSADAGEHVDVVGGRVRTAAPAALGERCRVGLGNRCSIRQSWASAAVEELLGSMDDEHGREFRLHPVAQPYCVIADRL